MRRVYRDLTKLLQYFDTFPAGEIILTVERRFIIELSIEKIRPNAKVTIKIRGLK